MMTIKTLLTGWLKSSCPVGRRFRFIPRLEWLDDRLTPATFVMRKDAPSFSWTDPLTWDTDPNGPTPGEQDTVIIREITGTVQLGGQAKVSGVYVSENSRLTVTGGALTASGSVEVTGAEVVFDGVNVTASSLVFAASVGGLKAADVTADVVAVSGNSDVRFEGRVTARQEFEVFASDVALTARLSAPAVELVGGDTSAVVDLGGQSIGLDTLTAGGVVVRNGELVAAGRLDLVGALQLEAAGIVAGVKPDRDDIATLGAVVVNGPRELNLFGLRLANHPLVLLADAAEPEFVSDVAAGMVTVPRGGAFTLTGAYLVTAAQVVVDGTLMIEASGGDYRNSLTVRDFLNRGEVGILGGGQLGADQMVVDRFPGEERGGRLRVEAGGEARFGADRSQPSSVGYHGELLVVRGPDDRPGLVIQGKSIVSAAEGVTVYPGATLKAAGAEILARVSNSGTIELGVGPTDDVGPTKGEALRVGVPKLAFADEPDYVQTDFGTLKTGGLVGLFNRSPGQAAVRYKAMAVLGPLSLSGTLDLDPGPGLRPVVLGGRSDLIGLVSYSIQDANNQTVEVDPELSGRFSNITGVLGMGGLWHPVHYNRLDRSIQVLTMQEPIVRGPGGGRPFLSQWAAAGGLRDNLVLITPGSAATAAEGPRVTGPDGDVYRIGPDGGLNRLWVADLADKIVAARDAGRAKADWDVATLDWAWYATGIGEDKWHPVWLPYTAARQAMDIGECLVYYLEQIGLASHFGGIHLYSHSAGSWLIDGFAHSRQAARGIRPEVYPLPPDQDTFVQTTFFDAFNPTVYREDPFGWLAQTGSAYLVSGESDPDITAWGTNVGTGGTMGLWADRAVQFVDQRWTNVASVPVMGSFLFPAVPLTDEILPYVANYNITPFALDGLAPLVISGSTMRAALNGLGGTYIDPRWLHLPPQNVADPLGTVRFAAHAWPTRYYRESVAGAGTYAVGEGYWYGFQQAPEFTGLRRVFQSYGESEGERGSVVTLPERGGRRSGPVAPTYTVAAGPVVRTYNGDGTERFAAQPFGSGGSVRTASADFTGDGVADVVIGTGPGQASRVVVLDGVTGAEVFAFDPFDPAFTGGVFVAAGDMTGDGVPDLVVSAGAGGGPHVKVFDGATRAEILSFFAYDLAFRGGVSVAVGDLDGDGAAEVVTGAGAGGGPHVKAFSRTGALVTEFMAYDPAFRGGVSVAAGDLDGDGYAEIVTGAGAGGGPNVRAFDGRTKAKVRDFFAYDPAFRGGVNVSTADLDGDWRADIVTGAGAGGGPHVRGFGGQSLALAADFMAEDISFVGGVYVG